MTVETELDNLTTSVNSLVSNVTTKKAILDADVSSAASSTATCVSHADTAKGYQREAEQFKETTYDSLRSINSISTQDLSGLTKDLTENAVDVFVYDTSKDSDGGAWRNRTQHTSWYNEELGTSTRGFRKEFPAVAVIVSTGSDLTIYDGDDPTMPMWLTLSVDSGVRFAQDGYGFDISALTARDGKIFTSLTQDSSYEPNVYGALIVFDYVADTSEKYAGTGSGSNRGVRDGVRYVYWGGHMNIVENDNKLVSGWTNDVAVTVLDGAPIDPKTNLPVPTIAVGTEGGVSVIKDDGNIFDITGINWGSKCDALEFNNDGILFFAQERYYLVSCDVKGLTEDITGLQDGRSYRRHDLDSYPLKQVSGKNYIGFDLDKGIAVSTNDDFDVAYSMYNYYPHRRLVLSTEGNKNHRYAGDSQMSAYITDTYNTGWMHGDIKLATLASTTAETLTSSEMITNGTFDSDVNSWSGSDFRWDGSGAAERYQGNTNSSLVQNINIVKGEVYKIEYDVIHTSGWDQSNVFIDTGSGSITLGNTYGSAHVVDYFRAESTKLMQFRLYGINDFRGTFDNVSIKRVEPNLVVKESRVARAGLNVNGTIVKSAVATGAELMKYGGFTTNNYLTQDYNSDLDFGTGDFSISFWLKDNAGNSTSYVLERLKADGTTDLAVWRTTSSSTRQLRIQTNVGSVQLPTLAADQWSCINFVRRDGVIYGYVNGKLESTGSNLGDISSNQHLALGARSGGNTGNGNWGLSLFRISATAPTPEQIEKIYRDEKPLFQEGAKCTLYGSDTVKALDYDEDENLLYAGTPSGTSMFSGLQRIDNTTHAVNVAISASNGLVIEE